MLIGIISIMLFTLPMPKIPFVLPKIILAEGLVLSLIFFFDSYTLLCFIYFAWGFTRGLVYTLAYSEVKSNFHGGISKLGPSIF